MWLKGKVSVAGSRTENATKNLKVAVICKLGLFGMAFVARTVFIRILGAEYAGVSSLYSNLLNLLNLAEFGFGGVLTYELYKPLKEHDEETITTLVALFKKIYSVVIAVVLGSGLLLIPFLGVIVKSNLNSRDLLIYYLLYLLNSVTSYFVAYRKIVIEADQKRYIENLIDVGSKFAMYLFQTVYLIFTKDFLGYLILQILFTVLMNVILHRISLKIYPYLRKLPRKQSISEDSRKRIYRNSRSMFITKLSIVVLNQTDSIIISILFGTVMVGYYSNYYMLVTYILSIYGIVFSSIEASVGNLNVDAASKKSFQVYKRLDYMLFGVNLICTVVFLCVVQDFIGVWIGEQYRQGFSLVLSLMFSFYLQCAMDITSTFRQTMGLFVVTKRVYPVMVVLNVILSVILGKWIGITGVALATGASRLLTSFWYEGKCVYLKMGHRLGEYLCRQTYFFLVLIATGGISYCICRSLPVTGILAVLIKGLASLLIAIAALVVTGYRTEEWKWMRRRICSVLERQKILTKLKK